MTKPGIEVKDGGLATIGAIKEVAGLDKHDFKEVDEAVKRFVAKHEETTAKTPRAWKNPVWKGLAEDFLEKDENGVMYFHESRNGMPVNALTWPSDKDSISYIIFSWIKFNAIKHHGNKRKVEQEASGGTPTKKAKTAKKESEDEAAKRTEDGGRKEEDGVKPKDESISVKRKSTPKKAAVKADDAKTPKKIAKNNEDSGKGEEDNKKKTDEAVIEDSDDENNLQTAMHASRADKKDEAKADSPKPSLTPGTLPNPGFNFSMAKSQAATDAATDTDAPQGSRTTSQAPEVDTPTVDTANTSGEETKEKHSDNHPSIAESIEVRASHDGIDKKFMSQYLNLSEDEDGQVKNERNKSISVEADKRAVRVDTPADTPMGTTEHDDAHGGVKNLKHELFASTNGNSTNVKDYTPHTPISHTHPADLSTRRHTPVASSVASITPFKHAKSITLDVSILATPNTAMTTSVSRLMVIPTSMSFAEVLGKYILQLPQGDLGHQALADAASCKVRATGRTEQVFGMRDAHVERMWRAAVGKAVRGLSGEDEVVELEIF